MSLTTVDTSQPEPVSQTITRVIQVGAGQAAGGTAAAVDRSVTAGVATGTIMAANASRRGFYIQNRGTSPIYVFYGTPAVQATSAQITPGSFIGQDVCTYFGPITVITDTAGQPVVAQEW